MRDHAFSFSFPWLAVLFANLGLIATPTAADTPPGPFAMEWSTTNFGPDGPWHAVQVYIGTPQQPISLYPGGTLRSHFLTPQICSNKTLSPGSCYATVGGLYNSNSSSTAFINSKFSAFTDFSHGGLRVRGPAGIGALDDIRIGQGAVPNATIAIHNDVESIYPGGATQALQVGTLGLGYLGTGQLQSFTGTASALSGNVIPGYLKAMNITSSNSFGLHIGSVRPKIPSSLYFGGYDQNRICGNVSSQQGPFANIDGDVPSGFIDLLDISINVIDGSSPWNTSSINGILTSGNSSVGSSLSVVMLPEAPYLNLPKSTCDAIIAWLPVTYQPNIGLYTWNIDDPQYLKIVSSASALSFAFRKDQLNSQNITINVPFSLLNLTLEAPLSKNPIPYFPCNAQSYGKYSLGRAFLQAAFIGANWNANNNQGTWWLAQAPGPNIPSQSSAKTILDQDSAISASDNDWAASWKGAWTALANTPTQGPVDLSSGILATEAVDEEDNGISTPVKGGIGAGVGICALVGVGAAFFFIKRRRRSAAAAATIAAKLEVESLPPPVPSKNNDKQLAEIYGNPLYEVQGCYYNERFRPAESHDRPQTPICELAEGRAKQPVYELR